MAISSQERSKCVKKVKNIILLAGVGMLLFWGGRADTVSAAVELKADEEGYISWTTTPTMASSGVRWRTQGFLVYARETTYGHPLDSGEPYGMIYVDDEKVKVKTEYDPAQGRYVSIFTIDADYTRSVIADNPELNRQFRENVEKGEAYIYLQNFFQSYRVYADGSETILTSHMYDIDTIRGDQNWANKQEWDSGYYNICIPYRVTGNVQVSLTDEAGRPLGTLAGYSSPSGEEVRTVLADGVLRKNPSLAFYQKRYAALGLCDSMKQVYVGDTVSVRLPLQVMVDGRTYELYRSFYYQSADEGEKLSDTRLKEDREGTLTKQICLGLKKAKVIGRYREVSQVPVVPDAEEVMEGSLTRAEPIGDIKAAGGRYDVRQGIPVTEALQTQVRTEQYLAGYRFVKKTGTRTYPVTGRMTWHLTWIEGEGEAAETKTASQTVMYTVPVSRT